MDARSFHESRRFADTSFGRIAYIERGSGPVAIFVHGFPLNGFQWRDIIESVAGVRRGVAIDQMGLGHTQVSADKELSLPDQAAMIAEVADALDADRIDLVGNDSGGGICQAFAARFPQRVRSLTLTNCEVHDFWPNEALRNFYDSWRAGAVVPALKTMLNDPSFARAGFASAYEDPSHLTDEAVRVYLEPILASEERIATLERLALSNHESSLTVALEPALKRLEAPTLVIWGDADVFFDARSKHWLEKTIPGFRRLISIPQGKLFFPEERPALVAGALRELWASVE
jgi:pimeloyl-ACP methyl ester carboxylesterase